MADQLALGLYSAAGVLPPMLAPGGLGQAPLLLIFKLGNNVVGAGFHLGVGRLKAENKPVSDCANSIDN